MSSNLVEIKAVVRLQEQFIAQKKLDKPYDGTTPQSQELTRLWEFSTSSHQEVACAACDVILSLVQKGHVCFNYVLKTFLNNAPSAKNLTGLCRSLTDLLVLQLISVQTKDGTTAPLPYSIRSPPHPYITLLTNRPDTWPLILEQVHRLLSWKHNKVQDNLTSLLGPFIRFILLEPQQSVQFSQIRGQLPRSLLQGAKIKPTRVKVIEFLLDLVPCLQINSTTKLGEVTCFIDELSHHIARGGAEGHGFRPGQRRSGFESRLVRHLLSLSLVLQANGLDPGHILDTVLNVLTENPEVARSEVNIVAVSELLWTSYHNLPVILQIGRLLIDQREPLNPFLSAILVMPTLHALSMPRVTMDTDAPSANQRAASQLISCIQESVEKGRSFVTNDNEIPSLNSVFDIMTSESSFQIYANLCNAFVSQPSSVKDWLRGVQSALSTEAPSCHVTFLVVAVLVVSRDLDIIQSALRLLPLIANHAEDQAVGLLPVLMYRLSQSSSPALKLNILNTIPDLAKSKASVGPILRTIQLLSNTAQLKPLSLRLMTSLWRQQDRCFPHLHNLLQDGNVTAAVTMETKVNELTVAKAACIRDICKLRGQQYGEDVLSLLSEILNKCTRKEEGGVAAMALEGLRALCEAEVIDMITTWSVLAPKLNQDKRRFVIGRICDLFSLVPDLEVDSQEYQDFTTDVLGRLWTYTRRADVSSFAYKALAAFKQEQFTLDMLPEEVTQSVREAILAANPDIPEEEVTTPAPPGACYVKLLPLVPEVTLTGYSQFMTSQLTNEVSSLPRGIHHASARKQAGSTNHSRALGSIPEFLRTQYEKNKQPALRQGITVGLLFTFDPPVETGRDGKPRRQSLTTRGRMFHQMLYTLLHEISVDETDWHRSVVLNEGWVGFMERCYSAYTQYRSADLELKLQQAEVADLEEHKLHVMTTWLWSRDKLFDLIKSASKGSPGAQANSICAAIGLAVASSRHACALDADQQTASRDASEYSGQSYWLSNLSNTLLAILEPGRPPSGRIFPLCHQSRAGDRASSTLARGSTAAAVSSLVRLLATTNTDVIYHVIASLQRRVPGEGEITGDQEGTLGFYHGVGLGRVLAALFEERFLEVTGSEGMMAVWKALNVLENAAFSTNQNRLGSVLGLSVCMSAMCADSRVDSRVHVSTIYEKLVQQLETIDQADPNFPALCWCLSHTAVSAYKTSILTQDTVNLLVAHLYEAHLSHPHSAGAHLALGALCYGLLKAGHPTVGDLAAKLGQSWITTLQDQEVVSEQRVACAAGLFSLAGSESGTSGDDDLDLSSEGPTLGVKVTEVIQTATDAVTSHSDLGTHNACAWLLGRLYASLEGSTASSSSVPGNYNYLADSSLLRPVIGRLLDAVKSPSGSGAQNEARLFLRCLTEAASGRLPPINLAAILSGITREFPDTELLCVELAVKQSEWSPSAALYVTAQIQPAQFCRLKRETQSLIYRSLPSLVRVVSASKLETFIESEISAPFVQKDATGLRLDVLRGLTDSLRIPDPPQHVTYVLYQAVGNVYRRLPDVIQVDLYDAFCTCLQLLPDDVIDQVTMENDLDSVNLIMKVMYIRCHLIGSGSQPLNWINQSLEAALFNQKCYGDTLLWILTRCFLGCKQSASQKNSSHAQTLPAQGATHNPIVCQQWLLELMGYTKSLTTGATPVPQGCQLTRVLDLCTQVFAAAVITWSGVKVSLILGVNSVTSSDHVVESVQSETRKVTRYNMMVLLPSALHSLTSVEPWKHITTRLIDWLVHMHRTDAVETCDDLKTVYKACLQSLRHSKDFSKLSVWSTVYSL